MSDYRPYASPPQTGRSSEMLDGHLGSDEFRRRAARYRLLAQTLLNPDVIEVVLDCALDLEMQASVFETADHIKRAIANQDH